MKRSLSNFEMFSKIVSARKARDEFWSGFFQIVNFDWSVTVGTFLQPMLQVQFVSSLRQRNGIYGKTGRKWCVLFITKTPFAWKNKDFNWWSQNCILCVQVWPSTLFKSLWLRGLLPGRTFWLHFFGAQSCFSHPWQYVVWQTNPFCGDADQFLICALVVSVGNQKTCYFLML